VPGDLRRIKMKLGLLSAILPDLTFEEVVDFAALTGFV
jgi:sugar phosphate isomerase/epimerase